MCLDRVLETDILNLSEWWLYFYLHKTIVGRTLTSLRKRLDAIIVALAVVREKVENCRGYPPCCLAFHKDNRISCDMLGPMPERAFLLHCKKCRENMKEILDNIRPLDADSIR